MLSYKARETYNHFLGVREEDRDIMVLNGGYIDQLHHR